MMEITKWALSIALFVWILSRTPTLNEAVYQGIINRLMDQKYDPSRLQRKPQPPS